MGAPGRQREGAARGEAEQAPLGVQRVQQWEEVVLIRAAAVEEDERAFGLPGSRALQRVQLH